MKKNHYLPLLINSIVAFFLSVTTLTLIFLFIYYLLTDSSSQTANVETIDVIVGKDKGLFFISLLSWGFIFLLAGGFWNWYVGKRLQQVQIYDLKTWEKINIYLNYFFSWFFLWSFVNIFVVYKVFKIYKERKNEIGFSELIEKEKKLNKKLRRGPFWDIFLPNIF